MAAQKIGFPRRPAIGFKKCLVRAAEFAQSLETRNHNTVLFCAGLAWIARDDFMDEFFVGACVCQWSIWFETGMIKELARGADHYEATMIIRWRRVGILDAHRASDRIKMIFPDQLVREREGVALEFESAQSRGYCGGGRHFSEPLPFPLKESSIERTLVFSTNAEACAW